MHVSNVLRKQFSCRMGCDNSPAIQQAVRNLMEATFNILSCM